MQGSIRAVSIKTVKRRLCNLYADLVTRVEAEELKASGRRILVDQIEVAVVPSWSGNEFVAMTIDAEQEIGIAAIPRKAQAELIVNKGQVEAHSTSSKAQTKRIAPLQGHV